VWLGFDWLSADEEGVVRAQNQFEAWGQWQNNVFLKQRCGYKPEARVNVIPVETDILVKPIRMSGERASQQETDSLSRNLELWKPAFVNQGSVGVQSGCRKNLGLFEQSVLEGVSSALPTNLSDRLVPRQSNLSPF
jgi:hypothetical protein